MNKKKNKDKEVQLETAVSELKKGYELLAKNKAVMDDLRNYCALNIPTDLSGKMPDLDNNKVLIMAGAARVMQRIDYFINTPVEQIINKYKGA